MASNTDAVIAAAEQLTGQARRMLEGQIKELDEEAQRLQRAHGELGGSVRPSAPRTPRPKPPKAKAPAQRKRSREFWETKIIAELHKRPGTIADLTKRLKRHGLKKDSTTLFAPAKSLEEQGRIVKKGAVLLLPAEADKAGAGTRSTASAAKSKEKDKPAGAKSKAGGKKAGARSAKPRRRAAKKAAS